MAEAATKTTITTEDGHSLTAWRCDPVGPPKGAIIILHAVYGLTDHMGDVCTAWAREGYAAVAPALFDRVGLNRVHAYSRAGADAGIVDYAALSEATIFADLQGCMAALRPAGKIAISGFCTGGTWAWRAGAALPFDAQVNYYGSHVPAFVHLTPLCPTLMHYGDSDTIMPLDQVTLIAVRHPAVSVRIYPGAGHAFFNPDQAHPDPLAAALSWRRSVGLMEAVVSNGAA